MLFQQASTPWRKATAKLEGEPEYEDLSKIDRLEVFDEYMRSLTTCYKCHPSQPTACGLMHTVMADNLAAIILLDVSRDDALAGMLLATSAAV